MSWHPWMQSFVFVGLVILFVANRLSYLNHFELPELIAVLAFVAILGNIVMTRPSSNGAKKNND